ncbi:unnamed protein product [Auanema sp. JU1783]|nr:unnamed protein product [Auanema sp. JU1783]
MMLPQGSGAIGKENFFDVPSGSMIPSTHSYVQHTGTNSLFFPSPMINFSTHPYQVNSLLPHPAHPTLQPHHIANDQLQQQTQQPQRQQQVYPTEQSLSTSMNGPNAFHSYEIRSPATAVEPHYTLPHDAATAGDSSQRISHVLQCYQQGGEDADYVRKAIESLVKKLKDKRTELDSLITAITSNGKQATGCVTIQRSLDGRLQVAGRKGVPHVVYARIWRWPNVSKNELVKLSICTTTQEHQDCICINPYHYEQVVSNSISPMGGMQSTNSYYSKNTGGYPNPKTLNPPPAQHPIIQDVPQHYQSAQASVEMEAENEEDYSGMQDSRPSESGYPLNWDSSCSSSQAVLPDCMDVMMADNRPDFNKFPYDTAHNDEMLQDDRTIPAAITSAPLEHWCTIKYYELDTQVGESVKVRTEKQEYTIDGGMDPHTEINSRFCVGAWPNVHRTEKSDNVRMNIRAGVKLRTNSEGQIFMEFHSTKPVFLRSGYLDYCSKVPYDSKAHRFTHEDKPTMVFDLKWAYKEMISRIHNAERVLRAQAAAVAGVVTNQKVEGDFPSAMVHSSVDGMRRSFCTFEFSFVKGWGVGYNKATIKDTPCWIEVQLHRSLQILDYVLKKSRSI